jgi:hypothetical protein
MTLLDEISAENVSRYPECTVGLILRGLPDDEADELRIALDAPQYKSEAIARALVSRGFDIGGTTIGRHRKRVCKCPSSRS